MNHFKKREELGDKKGGFVIFLKQKDLVEPYFPDEKLIVALYEWKAKFVKEEIEKNKLYL